MLDVVEIKKLVESWVSPEVEDILAQLAPYAIVVGSAARGGHYNDIDLVVNAKGFKIAKEILPPPLSSVFPGHIKTFETEPPIEVMKFWYGPDYNALCRKKLGKVQFGQTEMRSWATDPRDKSVGLKYA
jgi:hypothetical protein